MLIFKVTIKKNWMAYMYPEILNQKRKKPANLHGPTVISNNNNKLVTQTNTHMKKRAWYGKKEKGEWWENIGYMINCKSNM